MTTPLELTALCVLAAVKPSQALNNQIEDLKALRLLVLDLQHLFESIDTEARTVNQDIRLLKLRGAILQKSRSHDYLFQASESCAVTIRDFCGKPLLPNTPLDRQTMVINSARLVHEIEQAIEFLVPGKNPAPPR